MTLRRPAPPPRPAGLLGREHFQVAWATNDIARARAEFDTRFGIAEWRTLAGALPKGGDIHIELAWTGGVMVELLTADGPGSAPFMDRVPAGDFAIIHHHLGYLVRDEADWDALLADVARAGGTVAHSGDTPGFMRTAMVEVPLVGHALEFILPGPAGIAFFEGVPGI